MANILIVDDDPRIQILLQQLLKAKGHEGFVAENGACAIEVVRKHAFDLIITDLRMPKMNGMDLLREVKALYPDLPVLMVTAYASDETTVESVKLGVFDYMDKPFKIDDLMSAIDRALSAPRGEKRAVDHYEGSNPAIIDYLASMANGE